MQLPLALIDPALSHSLSWDIISRHMIDVDLAHVCAPSKRPPKALGRFVLCGE
jgi:hypothetical protein